MVPIIKSFLDTDAYKLFMGQAVWDRFPSVHAKYKFVCRGGQLLANELDTKELSDQIQSFMATPITPEEAEYLATLESAHGIPFSKYYIDFLKNWPNESADIRVEVIDNYGRLEIDIDGPWKAAIYLEVPVLAIVNEMYYRYQSDKLLSEERLISTIRKLYDNNIVFSDFGTRRRRSLEWHKKVVDSCVMHCHWEKHIFAGTSNIKMAMDHHIRPIGTMAHEWIQAGQGLFHPLNSQREMLEEWATFYPPCTDSKGMRIALTDTLGIRKFMKDFDYPLAQVYDGVRQDSGDPIWWTDWMLGYYKALGINPEDKVFVYSDCLDAEKCITIAKHLDGRAKCSFGIGTNLTNNFGDKALQNVIKLVEINGRPVAKISDTAEKAICTNTTYLAYLKDALNV